MAISVSQTFKRTSANPIDESMALTKAQMVTVNDNLMPAYYFTICQDDGKIYLYDKTATASATTGKFKEFESGTTITVDSSLSTTSENPVQNKVITLAMGVLSNLTTTDKTSLVNAINEINTKIVTMTGATSSTAGTAGLVPAPAAGDELKFLKGDGTWATVSTGAGGHTILDTDGDSMPAEDNLQFIGLDVTDNSTDGVTEVESAGLNSDSLNDVTDGSIGNEIINNGMTYSTNEQIVGKWIDGKPLYQMTGTITNDITINGTTTLISNFVTTYNVSELVSSTGSVIYNSNSQGPFTSVGNGTMCVFIASGNLNLYIPFTSATINKVTYTIKYTKATD